MGVGGPGGLREEFEDPWVAWNVVRTVLLTVALGLLVKAAAGSRAAARDQRSEYSISWTSEYSTA
ncbi:hypothetical protein [Streptomyces sviceus]|uniref:hypothetical protein n=1 Tax=Streptomyces sviceus TaxID=285530 RepID=UPI0036E1CA9D